jgi:hypothetical protein
VRPGERDHWRNPFVGGMIVLKWIFRNWVLGMDWIKLDQDRYRKGHL